MAADRRMRIAVAGAGNIGCYVGGCLALAGRDVTLLLRPALAEAIARHGLRVSDLDGVDRVLAPSAVRLATDPAAAFAEADVVLVTVKSGATSAMAGLIAEHATSGVTVVSLQNGVGNVDVLLARLGGMARVVPGMVPFNVVQTLVQGQPVRVHRATSGTVQIGAGAAGLREALAVQGVGVAESRDMAGVLWGKLLLNLNNALNALAGIPLAAELARQALAAAAGAADRGGAQGAQGGRHPAGAHRGRSAGSCAAHPEAARLAVPARGGLHAGHRPGGALLHVGGFWSGAGRPRSTTSRARSCGWPPRRVCGCRSPSVSCGW